MTTHRNKLGDVREDGKIFYNYNKTSKNGESWVSPETFLRCKISHRACATQARAEKKGIPYNVTSDYLRIIYPGDGMCPVLGIPMVWGSEDGRDNSPSIDRIIPELGYVPGNIIWVCELANRVKPNAPISVIGKVYEFYNELT